MIAGRLLRVQHRLAQRGVRLLERLGAVALRAQLAAVAEIARDDEPAGLALDLRSRAARSRPAAPASRASAGEPRSAGARDRPGRGAPRRRSRRCGATRPRSGPRTPARRGRRAPGAGVAARSRSSAGCTAPGRPRRSGPRRGPRGPRRTPDAGRLRNAAFPGASTFRCRALERTRPDLLALNPRAVRRRRLGSVHGGQTMTLVRSAAAALLALALGSGSARAGTLFSDPYGAGAPDVIGNGADFDIRSLEVQTLDPGHARDQRAHELPRRRRHARALHRDGQLVRDGVRRRGRHPDPGRELALGAAARRHGRRPGRHLLRGRRSGGDRHADHARDAPGRQPLSGDRRADGGRGARRGPGRRSARGPGRARQRHRPSRPTSSATCRSRSALGGSELSIQLQVAIGPAFYNDVAGGYSMHFASSTCACDVLDGVYPAARRSPAPLALLGARARWLWLRARRRFADPRCTRLCSRSRAARG